MNPRVVIAWSVACAAVALLLFNPLYRVILLLVAGNVIFVSKRRDAKVRPVIVLAGVATVISVLLNVLLSHYGTHVLLTIPRAIPLVGGIITGEAVAYSATIAVGFAAVIVAFAPVSLALESHDLIDALPGFLHRTATAIAAALNMVSGIGGNVIAISDAEKMRGNTKSRWRLLRSIFVPVIVTTMEDSLQLAEAMEARGFGNRQRTRYSVPRFSSGDVAVLAAAATAIIVVVVLQMRGALQEWFPFPTMTAPPIEVVPIIACLLLIVPVVAWQKSQHSLA